MRVLGIDPGLQCTGYGCVETRDEAIEPLLIEGGVLRLRADDPVPVRLAQLHRDLSALLAELRPQVVVVERIFSHAQHAHTAMLMGHARGVILLAAQMEGVAIEEILPTAVKKSLTGNGHATKSQMQRAVMVQLGLAAPPEPHDVADAIAMALCAARRLGAPSAAAR
jgi:crossover junction endodeoxyribonuclease RuvC